MVLLPQHFYEDFGWRIFSIYFVSLTPLPRTYLLHTSQSNLHPRIVTYSINAPPLIAFMFIDDVVNIILESMLQCELLVGTNRSSQFYWSRHGAQR
jgi:hypothetical protein